jgi:alpha-ribazole phosphatase
VLIYLIRHTTPEIESGICYGQTDIPLNENTFEQEFQLIRTKIPDTIERVYTSPLERCKRLAERLSPEYREDSLLMEMNFGEWENRKWDGIDADDLYSWTQDFVNISVPKGESYRMLHERTVRFIENILTTNDKAVAIVTHAGNIRSFISWTLDLPLENSFRILLNYGAVITMEIEKDKSYNKIF